MTAGLRPLIAGNWKMHGLRAEAVALASDVKELAAAHPAGKCEILLCPPATVLHDVHDIVGESPIALGGQDCHTEQTGAHTGDISAAMLRDAGCEYVILGHSERRRDHGESDALVRRKILAAATAGLSPIVCVGETMAERDSGATLGVIARQIAGSLPDEAPGGLVIAYEPVWAIGTGRTPTESEIAEVHAHIRGLLRDRDADSQAVRILYGGSVNAANARAILAIADVDGALVGGASLKAPEFWAIAESCP